MALRRAARAGPLALLLAALLLGAGCGQQPSVLAKPSAAGSITSKAVSKPVVAAAVIPPCYCVQVGAYESRTSAAAVAGQLSVLYELPVTVTPVATGHRTVYRVRVLVKTSCEAEALAATLSRNQKLKAWIVARP